MSDAQYNPCVLGPTDTMIRSSNTLRLSIVVNNYNYACYLPEALESALGQMREGDELIVVDDGSTDESPALLTQYAREHGIRMIQQDNRGQMLTVRVGIQAARGDIVVLLDSDDYFLPGYLDRLRKVYAEHPEVSFVFANARVKGDSLAASNSMRRLLRRLEHPHGKVGSTMWSTVLFHEFVGMPTSGISLHKSLADRISTLPAKIGETATMPLLLSTLLGVSKTELENFGHTADGVIVRCASIFGALKYYDHNPGFMYRIHGSNKYATTSRPGRSYLLHKRRKQFGEMIRQHIATIGTPSAVELRQEILGRSFAVYRPRCAIVRAQYCRAILTSEGTVAEKLAALAAALGIQGRTD